MLRVVCLSHFSSSHFRQEIVVDLTISAEFRLSQDRKFLDWRDKLKCDAISGVKKLSEFLAICLKQKRFASYLRLSSPRRLDCRIREKFGQRSVSILFEPVVEGALI